MDMEKMRKVNELAAELKKHKMFLGDEDTVKKAQEIVLDGESPLVMPKETAPEGKEPVDAEILVKESNKAIKEQMDLFRKALLQLNEELKEFKKETAEKLEKIKQLALSTPPVKPEPTKDDMPATAKPAKPEDTQKSQSPGTEEKKGGFTPEDVAVDKVFYFGQK